MAIPSYFKEVIREFVRGEGSSDVADQAPVQSVNNNAGDVSLIGTDGAVRFRRVNQQLAFTGPRFGARKGWTSYITIGDNNEVRVVQPDLKLKLNVDGQGGVTSAYAKTGLTPETVGPYEVTFSGITFSAIQNATLLRIGFGADTGKTGFPVSLANDGAVFSIGNGEINIVTTKDDPNNFVANETIHSAVNAGDFAFPADFSIRYDSADNMEFAVNGTVIESLTLDRTDRQMFQPQIGIYDKGSTATATVDRVSYRPISGVSQ